MATSTRNRKHVDQPIIQVLADVSRSKAAHFVGRLAVGDSELDRRGGSRRLYDEILRDDQVKSTLQQRFTGLMSCPWEVVPGGDSPQDREAALWLKDQLDRVGWLRKAEKMLYGLFYGYAVAEMIWGYDGGKIAIQDIKVRDRHRFRFGEDGKLRLLSSDKPLGEEMPDRKFWTFTTGGDHDDRPYGLGLAHWLYWPCFFKRNGLKFWLLFLDKYGSPSVKGKYSRNATEQEKKQLLEAATALRQEAAVAIPEGMELELVEATRSASSDYGNFYEAMDRAIAKIVLSQTMTTDDGSSLAQAKVHENVAWAVVEADGDALSESFNVGPARWLTEWNFPGAKPPRVRFVTEDPEDLDKVVKRDQTLWQIGFEPTEERVRETYGEGYVKRPLSPEAGPGDKRPAPPERADFAEGQPLDLIDRFIAEHLRADWQELADPVIAPVLAAADDAEDFDDFIARITRSLPDMDVSRLTEHLARAAFNARLAASAEMDGSAPEDSMHKEG